MKDKPDDYKNMIDLLAVFSEAKQRLAALENESQGEFMEIVDARRSEYADLQGKISEAETALDTIARNHPEWFTEKRSVKTPYGVVKVTRTSKLKASNPEASILRIEHAGYGDQFVRIQEAKIDFGKAVRNLEKSEASGAAKAA